MGKKEKDAGGAAGGGKGSAENIKVIVRCRPLNTKEKDSGYKSCVDLNLGESTVQVNHVCGDPDRWTFDAVVNNTYTQRDVFTQFIMPMIDSVMDGFNATVFAYGQSGSGKTHTMTGKLDDPELCGIIPRTFDYVFTQIREQQKAHPGRTFSVSCTFVELYNGKIHDLLAKAQVPLAVKESKDKTFFVQGVHAPMVKFPEDLTRHMEEGTERRRVASTDLNADSSRSHSLFTLVVDMVDTDDDGTTRSVTSKFNLVDLAGSERQSKTGAAGDTLKEGCNINLSLSALGTVIDTLVKGKGHVPFRSSPLTMLLKDSLGGSSKTVMFANIGPSEHNLSETVSTLRFADRAKQIKNKPVVNLDTKDQKIQELTEQVNELREKLKQFESVGVQKMEEELEQLRERAGELEVDLDNATKGREADQLEAQQARDSLNAELDRLKAELEEAQSAIESLKSESLVQVDQLRDERARREEIWASCTAHFGEEVRDVDSLLNRLRALATAVSKEDHLRLVAELRTQAAEVTAARDALESDIASQRAAAAAAQEEADSLRKKLDKAKERLEKEKDARKMMLQETSFDNLSPGKSGAQQGIGGSADPAALAELESKIADLEAREEQHSSEQDAAVAEIQARKDAEIQKLQAQLAAISAAATEPSDDDTGAVRHLKKLVSQKEASLVDANATIQALEVKIDELVKKMKRSGGRGNRSAAATTASEPSPSQLKHAESRANLRNELQATAEHRDELLRHVVDGGEAPSDLGDQLRRLSEENARLRQQLLDGQAMSEELEATKAELTEHQDALGEAAQLRAEAGRASDLERAVADLQRQLDRSIQEASAKEAELLGLLSKKRRGSDRPRKDSAAAAAAAAETESTTAEPAKTDENDGGEEEEDEENPLVGVVEVLHREKALLAAEVSKLSKDLRELQCNRPDAAAQQQVDHHHADAEFRELQAEVQRLRELVSAPAGGDAPDTAALKAELKRRDDLLSAAEAKAAHAIESNETSPQKNSTSNYNNASGSEMELAVQLQRVQMELAELQEQVETAKTDAGEAEEKRDSAKREAAAAAADAAAKSKELSEAKLQLTALENKVAELEGDRERVANDHSTTTQQIDSLTQRLKERTDQMNDLRQTIEHFKDVAEGHKAKVEQFKKQLADKQAEYAEREMAHQTAMAEQEQSFQRMMNKRLEQQAEEHRKALSRKDEDIAAAKKKTKKMEEKIEKFKEKYDQKVYEYEELLSRMEQQKFEQMKQLRDRDVVEIEETQERVQDALRAAKEKRRMEADKFANGEVNSAVSGFRGPAGSAAAVARSRGSSGGVTPPAEELLQQQRQARPANYGVGRATANDAPAANVGGARNGGAGYNGYVPEPPRAAGGTARGSPAAAYGFDAAYVPDAYMNNGGGGGGGDIYDF